MNIVKSFIFTLLAVLLTNGCTGTEAMPANATQTGAVTGALAGSVIGYNTKGHHKGERAVIGGLLGAATGAAVGNAVDSNTPPPADTSGWHE
jgi:uncharacterized protein YcfJ